MVDKIIHKEGSSALALKVKFAGVLVLLAVLVATFKYYTLHADIPRVLPIIYFGYVLSRLYVCWKDYQYRNVCIRLAEKEIFICNFSEETFHVAFDQLEKISITKKLYIGLKSFSGYYPLLSVYTKQRCVLEKFMMEKEDYEFLIEYANRHKLPVEDTYQA